MQLQNQRSLREHTLMALFLALHTFILVTGCHIVVSKRLRSHNADLLSNVPNPIKHKPHKNLNPLTAASRILL